MNNKKNISYILIVLLLFSIDQLTKISTRNLANGIVGYSMKIFGDFFRITYVENRGGIFGLFQGHINIFTIISTLLIIYILISEVKNFYNYTESTRIAILFITAGAMGNMYDRIFRNYVIDMLDFRAIWQFIFNVADMYIHIGVYILFIAYIYRNVKKVK